jgi:adenylate cyclase
VDGEERPEAGFWDFTLDEFHDPKLKRIRWLMKRFPTNPRCKLCEAPFGGVGGKVLRLTGFRPSRKNPNLCTTCFEQAPEGGTEGEIGVLFADVRGFTALAEATTPGKAALLLNRFYAVATDALLARDALIDKLVGDEVMALFLPPVVGEDHLARMVEAAEALLRGVGFGTEDGAWLDVGVGLAFGHAFVGNVGHGEVKDFTAVGDVVNTASRLQGQAEAGTIVMADVVFEAVRERYPDAEELELELKGKSAPVRAHAVRVGTSKRQFAPL